MTGNKRRDRARMRKSEVAERLPRIVQEKYNNGVGQR